MNAKILVVVFRGRRRFGPCTKRLNPSYKLHWRHAFSVAAPIVWNGLPSRRPMSGRATPCRLSDAIWKLYFTAAYAYNVAIYQRLYLQSSRRSTNSIIIIIMSKISGGVNIWRIRTFAFTTRAARVVLFSVVYVCVCLFVCLSDNTITPEPPEISSRYFHGIILWSKGWKWLYSGGRVVIWRLWCSSSGLQQLTFSSQNWDASYHWPPPPPRIKIWKMQLWKTSQDRLCVCSCCTILAM